MAKRIKLEEGQFYAIELSDGTFTIAQLVHHHPITERKSEDTFAFFEYHFSTLKNIQEDYPSLDYSNPIAIATINGYPRTYGWIFLGKEDVKISWDYKKDISKIGFYKNRSTDPSWFLEPYFGLSPLDAEPDGFIDIVNNYFISNIKLGKKVKFLKDFSIEELKELLPANSPILIKLLEERQK